MKRAHTDREWSSWCSTVLIGESRQASAYTVNPEGQLNAKQSSQASFNTSWTNSGCPTQGVDLAVYWTGSVKTHSVIKWSVCFMQRWRQNIEIYTQVVSLSSGNKSLLSLGWLNYYTGDQNWTWWNPCKHFVTHAIKIIQRRQQIELQFFKN